MKFSKEDTLAVKGIAILLMFFHHNFLKMERFETYVIDGRPFSPETIVYLSQFCKICVGMFVFLSAYGMTLSFQKKSMDYTLTRKETIELTMRRYFKLMFGYWFIFILVQLFAVFYDPQRILSKYGGEGKIAFIGKFGLDMLGLSDLFGTPKFIPTWWYMSLAIVMIFVMPILLGGYRRFGGAVLAGLAVLLPKALGLDETDLVRWLLCIVLGIWFADKDILVRLKQWQITDNKYFSKGCKFILGTLGLYLLVVLRQSVFGADYMFLLDGIVPTYVIWYSYEFITGIRYVRNVLMFLGKHSMNMFLTHTFIRAVWFDEFIYSWKYVGLIMLALTVTSLMLSIVIEELKKLVRYRTWTGKLTEKLVNFMVETV